jgi:hypothetical protein
VGHLGYTCANRKKQINKNIPFRKVSQMADTNTQEAAVAVHPMHKSRMFISSKHIDLNDLSYLEAASMSLALVLAVTIGVLQAAVLS